MTNRDNEIIKLRPEIDFGDIPQPLEQFQEVLRQVLKFQHDVLVQTTRDYLEHKYKGFSTRDETVKEELFYQSLKKDIPFKKDLIGMIKGMFTSLELEYYLNNQQEINKRLVEFIYKRVLSELSLQYTT
ncbi:hypothetical protein I5M32_13515 [Pedobacter sp. SD-b]|uniref:Glyoxalase n=1 Tax=Pedobacter segetis TaxID=2793069 RepID=A0ABS1BNU1_9SPHI|nr:hypothetical protein [Pedobacter segetis]MBK0383981.1 hypothetical protein [Pedobacter segetis]